MKIIEILFEDQFEENILGIAKKYQIEDLWISEIGKDGRRFSRLLVGVSDTQSILDALQGALGKNTSSRILVMTAEAILPRAIEKDNFQEKYSWSHSSS